MDEDKIITASGISCLSERGAVTTSNLAMKAYLSRSIRHHSPEGHSLNIGQEARRYVGRHRQPLNLCSFRYEFLQYQGLKTRRALFKYYERHKTTLSYEPVTSAMHLELGLLDDPALFDVDQALTESLHVELQACGAQGNHGSAGTFRSFLS